MAMWSTRSISLRSLPLRSSKALLLFIIFIPLFLIQIPATTTLLTTRTNILKSQPLVSVVVTTYNVESFVETSIHAVLEQTYSNLQIIIVDDASADRTARKIELLIRNDSRATLVRLPMRTYGGVGIPANIGLNRAMGKYVAFVDGDDIPTKTFVERLVATAENTNSDIALCQFTNFDMSTGRREVSHSFDRTWWPHQRTVRRSQVQPLSPREHVGIFDVNPVPWRKIYRREFLMKNDIFFPEGDYFFEDNPFHWVILMYANRISYINEPLVNHRVGRKAQTTNAFHPTTASRIDPRTLGESTTRMEVDMENRKLIGTMSGAGLIKMVPNINYIGRHLERCNPKVKHCNLAREMFLRWMHRSRWIMHTAKQGGNSQISAKIASVYYRCVAKWRSVLGADNSESTERVAKPEKLLSIIIPTYNVERFLPGLIGTLSKLTVTHEVIFVDTNSSDRTLGRLKRASWMKSDWHVFHIDHPRAGLARNFGQLFAEGKYIFFADADDAFNPAALDAAVRYAILKDVDVLMLRYMYEYFSRASNGQMKIASTKDMVHQHMWFDRANIDLMGKKIFAASVPNYPWCKLVRRELIERYDVFHGPTPVNNDVQFHWHSIFLAQSIAFFDQNVIRHRVFQNRVTLTGVKSDRLALIDALILTNRVLVASGMAEEDQFHRAWIKFSKDLMDWGKVRVTESMRTEYSLRSRVALQLMSRKEYNDLAYV